MPDAAPAPARTASPGRRRQRSLPAFRAAADRENDLASLLRIVRAALFGPPDYLTSLFGPPYTWVLPHRRYSELTILDLWHPLRAAAFLGELTLPAFTREPPDLVRTLLPPLLHEWVWRPGVAFQQPDPYGSVTSFPRERWFFVNGVATNEAVVRMNAALLSRLFHRPLTVLHNPSASLLLDLVECAIGKAFTKRPKIDVPGTMTEPALRATQAILSALSETSLDRVVLLAHSQGTIIASNVLRAIRRVLAPRHRLGRWVREEGKRSMPRTVRTEAQTLVADLAGRPGNEPRQLLHDDLAHTVVRFGEAVKATRGEALEKLEVYTFANCADRMRCVAPGIPRIEHFANECDLVARLGVLSPLADAEDHNAPIRIDGPVYEARGTWGHLLNEHYLYRIYDYLSAGNDTGDNPYPLAPGAKGPSRPRLYAYFQGGRPG